jgi:uncharacterized protein with PIN domain
MDTVRFVVDAMLGNVARELRLLGYDALFARNEPDWEVLRLARAESRLLVTRDRELAKRGRDDKALLVLEEEARRQTVWVLREVGLDPVRDKVVPLSRCLECGTLLTERGPEEVRSKVPPYVAKTQDRFSVCGDCGRIYWHGTHAKRMVRRAEEIIAEAKGRAE